MARGDAYSGFGAQAGHSALPMRNTHVCCGAADLPLLSSRKSQGSVNRRLFPAKRKANCTAKTDAATTRDPAPTEMWCTQPVLIHLQDGLLQGLGLQRLWALSWAQRMEFEEAGTANRNEDVRSRLQNTRSPSAWSLWTAVPKWEH